MAAPPWPESRVWERLCHSHGSWLGAATRATAEHYCREHCSKNNVGLPGTFQKQGGEGQRPGNTTCGGAALSNRALNI